MPVLPPVRIPKPSIAATEVEDAYNLVRSGRDINEWSDEEKVLFVNATHNAPWCTSLHGFHEYSYPTFEIAKALQIDYSKIRCLLRQLRDEDKLIAKKWHAWFKSISAILSDDDVTTEELTRIRDLFGYNEWLEFIFGEVQAINSPFLPLTFSANVVPLKYFTKTLLCWNDDKTNNQVRDIVVRAAKHHLFSGEPSARFVENSLFLQACDQKDQDAAIYSIFLKSIYSDTGLVPSTDAWITLLFTEADQLCNLDDEQVLDADDEDCEIMEIRFCNSCAVNYNYRPAFACECVDRLHTEHCLFLMQKNVPIPPEFWVRCAYHNQWRLAHFLHSRRPESFELNIPASAFRKAIEYDRHGFVKFLVQYEYFSRSDVPPGAKLSPFLLGYLGTVSKKRRRDALMSAQAALDEFKQEMPENTYLRLCERFKEGFDQ